VRARRSGIDLSVFVLVFAAPTCATRGHDPIEKKIETSSITQKNNRILFKEI